MGIVATWLHVERASLASWVGRRDLDPAALEAALREKGVDPGLVNDVIYYGYEEPDPQWNSALALLTTVKAYDVDKCFTGSVRGLASVAAALPGAAAVVEWVAARRPVVKLPPPWKRTDIVGFEVVATADEVRALLPALAPFRERVACAAYAKPQTGGLLASWSRRKRSLRAWTEDDYYWNGWLRMLEALDDVAGSSADYLGLETG